MPKHIDNVPKLADFRPPWITEDGTEVEIDKDKLKKYIHNLVTDKAKAQDVRDETVESLKVAETDRDEYKKQVDSKDPDSAGKIAKLEKKVSEAEDKASKAQKALDRLEVATEKGLTPKQAKRLQGETREELEADADELIEDLGIKQAEKDPDDEDEDEDEDGQGRTTPQLKTKRLTNGGDAHNGSDAEIDFDKIAAEISGNRVI